MSAWHSAILQVPRVRLQTPRALLQTPRALLLLASLSLGGCVSYEPAVLVPSISLSPQQISVQNNSAGGEIERRVDFGIDATVNESDSLSNLQILPGIRVRSVTPGGAAAAAGIRAGDVILSVDGTTTDHPDTLAALETRPAEAEPYAVQLRRNTQVLEAQVSPRVLQASAGATAAGMVELYRIDPIASRAGYTTAMVSVAGQPDLAAARIQELLPESPLPEAGLEVGDYILSLDGRYLSSAQDLITRLNRDAEPGQRVVLGVYDGNTVRDVTLSLWQPGRRLSRLTLWPLLRYRADSGNDSASLSILDFWLFAGYRYNRDGSERSHTLFEVITFSSEVGTLSEVED